MSLKEQTYKKEIKMNIEEIFKGTTICKSGRNREVRRFYKSEKWARIFWDIMNPDQLCKGFDIHHKDLNKLNDDIDNLERITRSEHAKIHTSGEKNYMFGKKHSEYTKNKMSMSQAGEKNHNYGKKFSTEIRRKISLNHADFSGANHPRARAVMAEYQIFSTAKAAAIIFSTSSSTIRRRIKNNVPGYFYI